MVITGCRVITWLGASAPNIVTVQTKPILCCLCEPGRSGQSDGTVAW
jgi:hypothetical protein